MWIEWKWTAEKPYPETLDTKVRVWCANDYSDEMFPNSWTVRSWQPNWHPDAEDERIIAYKVVTND